MSHSFRSDRLPEVAGVCGLVLIPLGAWLLITGLTVRVGDGIADCGSLFDHTRNHPSSCASLYGSREIEAVITLSVGVLLFVVACFLSLRSRSHVQSDLVEPLS